MLCSSIGAPLLRVVLHTESMWGVESNRIASDHWYSGVKEIYKYRIRPEHGRTVLGSSYVPIKNPSTGEEEFIAEGIVGDPLYLKIEKADREFAKSSARSILASWDTRYNRRIYSAEEIGRARLFLIQPYYASGAGEEYGTWYADGEPNNDCALERDNKIYSPNRILRCPLSSHQVGPLRFPQNKMRKGCDIFMSWGSELIVSEKLGTLIERGGFTGGTLQPIWNTGAESKTMLDLSNVPSGQELLRLAAEKGLKVSDRGFWSWLEEQPQLPLLDRALWEQMHLLQSRRSGTVQIQGFRQLIVNSKPISVSSETAFGAMPFRLGSGESCRCSFGEVRGKSLLSQLFVPGESWNGADISRTDIYVGGNSGLFRPWQLLVFSGRLFGEMRNSGIKGFDFEIVQIA